MVGLTYTIPEVGFHGNVAGAFTLRDFSHEVSF
jgi:hypothetical protein